LKIKLKGLYIADVAEIQELNTDLKTDELNKFQKETFSAAFQKVYDRADACIYVNGAYFE
jgi:hypothetical protein